MPDALAVTVVERVRAAYEAAADRGEAVHMAAYMRDQFAFLGIKAPEQVRLAGAALQGLPAPADDELADVARRCWALPEREYQYFACRYLRRHVKGRPATLLDTVEALITAKSWWDTVDTLASHTVGPLVSQHPALVATMNRWIDSSDFWLARAAVLHQLGYKAATDEDRLFSYCLERAADDEFFIQKAIGWALREYSKTAPDAVADFVTGFEDRFSRLSVREALKRL